MRTLLLNRLKNMDDRTLGWMFCFDDDRLTPMAKFATLELPWRDNEHQVSRIPAGRYRVLPETDPKRGFILRVLDVPGRDGILVHRGMYPKDTEGCICIGTEFIGPTPTNCKGAQSKLQALITGDALLLVIDVP